MIHSLWEASKERDMDLMEDEDGAQTPKADTAGATHAQPTHGPLHSEHYPWGVRTTADSHPAYPPLPSSGSNYIEDVEPQFDPDYNHSGQNVGLGLDFGQGGFATLTSIQEEILREVLFTETDETAVNEDKVYDSDTSTPRASAAQLVESKEEVKEEEFEDCEDDGTRKTVVDSGFGFEILNPKTSSAEPTSPKAIGLKVNDPKLTDPKHDDSKFTHPKLTNPKLTDPKLTNPKLTDPKSTNPKFINPTTMADPIGAQSPSHSPRPPSPSPLPEVHLGAQSPSTSTGPGLFQAQDDGKQYDQGASQRIRPGATRAQMKKGRRPRVPWWEISSSFQLQEHLAQLVEDHNVDQNAKDIPLTRETVMFLVNTPERADRYLWLFELCRLCVVRCNQVAVELGKAKPKCTEETCPEMRASEWQYLCASHDPPKACCAIEYSYHTLEWAENQLSSVKNFPSRLTLGNPAQGGVQGGLRIITNIMRRCYRVFAHAWFSHRSAFWKVEQTYGAYLLYKTVCDQYSLMVQDSYTIPPEALGITEGNDDKMAEEAVKQETEGSENEHGKGKEPEVAVAAQTQTGATTRRHKHTPSMGSAVTTIHEGDEDDKVGGEEGPGDIPPEVLETAALKASSEEVLGEGKPTVAEEDKDLGEVVGGVEGLGLKEKEKGDRAAGGEEGEGS